ncbi:HNH endonuclease [Candidatus Woesearchaeota archaeon]|nr:HNH endonuclease [Candidatus Woesearchaeota archaeon]
MLRNCKFCGNSFEPSIKHPNQNSCNRTCSRKLYYKNNIKIFKKKFKERYEKVKHYPRYKEKVRINQKNWSVQNPERVKEINRKYKENHKNEILAKLRKYELRENACVFCNTKFMPDRNHPMAKCCSQKCRTKLWAKNYPEKFKQINIEKSKRYRERHPEKIKEQSKKSVESGRANKNQKVWRERHLEKAKELRKKQYWKNPEREREKVKEWRQTEAGKLSHRADSKRRQYTRKSKLANDFPLTRKKQDYIPYRDNNTCVYCHVEPNIVTLDHIIAQENKGNNSVNNLVVSCRYCNASKQDKQLEIWLKSDYCKLKGITKESINPIVWNLLVKQKNQVKLVQKE